MFNLIRKCKPIFHSFYGHVEVISTWYHHFIFFNHCNMWMVRSTVILCHIMICKYFFFHSIACLFILLFLLTYYKLYFMCLLPVFFFLLSKSQESQCMSAGIKTPKRWELIISNTTFVNFDLTDCVSIRTCSGCAQGQGKLF